MRPPHSSRRLETPPLGTAAARVAPLPATPQLRPNTGSHERPGAESQGGRSGTLPAPPRAHHGLAPYGPAISPPPLPGTPPLASRSAPDLSVPEPGESTSVLQQPLGTVQFPQLGQIVTGNRGTYEINSLLGEGAFGAVYECTGPFDQVYAVKMVRPANRPYADVQAEWAKEVTRLLSLRHPNVVYIYDAFETDHLFYLALERCDHALQDMLGVPLQEGLVLELARQLLAAVQYLHDADIVHDDLHGGNVLITHTRDRPQVKISDFGISHELRGHPVVRPNVVHHAIMAPEILSTGYTSKQSDIYQVGLLLYWMVTGEPAIDMKAPYEELVRVVAEGEPRQRAEAIGTPLGTVIAKMLRRRENFRYSSAREVWKDLRELEAWRQRSLFPLR